MKSHLNIPIPFAINMFILKTFKNCNRQTFSIFSFILIEKVLLMYLIYHLSIFGPRQRFKAPTFVCCLNGQLFFNSSLFFNGQGWRKWREEKRYSRRRYSITKVNKRWWNSCVFTLCTHRSLNQTSKYFICLDSRRSSYYFNSNRFLILLMLVIMILFFSIYRTMGVCLQTYRESLKSR